MAAGEPSGVILVTSEDWVSKWLRNATETRSTLNTGKKSRGSCVMALSRKERPFSGHFTDDGMVGITSTPAFETV